MMKNTSGMREWLHSKIYQLIFLYKVGTIV